VSASSVVTTAADGDGDLTVATTSVSSSAKDSSTTTVATGVTQASHTHATTMPSSVVNYIIKT